MTQQSVMTKKECHLMHKSSLVTVNHIQLYCLRTNALSPLADAIETVGLL